MLDGSKSKSYYMLIYSLLKKTNILSLKRTQSEIQRFRDKQDFEILEMNIHRVVQSLEIGCRMWYRKYLKIYNM